MVLGILDFLLKQNALTENLRKKEENEKPKK